MMTTNQGSKFEVLVEGKSRGRMELDETQWACDGVHPEFIYTTGFQNIEKDGQMLKGVVLVAFFKS